MQCCHTKVFLEIQTNPVPTHLNLPEPPPSQPKVAVTIMVLHWFIVSRK